MIVDSQLQIVSVVTITLLYFEIHPSCSVAYAPVYTRHRLKLAHSSVSWEISHESFFFFLSRFLRKSRILKEKRIERGV